MSDDVERYNTRFIVDVQRPSRLFKEDALGADNLQSLIVTGWGMHDSKHVQVVEANTWNNMDSIPQKKDVHLLMVVNSFNANPIGTKGFHYSTIYWDGCRYRYSTNDISLEPFKNTNFIAWTYCPAAPYEYRKHLE